MRIQILVAASLLFSACASMESADAPPIPANAVEATHKESNGDVVSEYRVQGQLTMVRVQPKHGPVYYLMDSNGDGRLDSSKGEGPVSPVYYRLYGW